MNQNRPTHVDEEFNRDLPAESSNLSDEEMDEFHYGPDEEHFHDPSGGADKFERLWACHCGLNPDSEQELDAHLAAVGAPPRGQRS